MTRHRSPIMQAFLDLPVPATTCGDIQYPVPNSFVDLADDQAPAEPRTPPWPKDPDAPMIIQTNSFRFVLSREMALDLGVVEPTPEEAEQRAADFERWRREHDAAVRLAWRTYDDALAQLDALDAADNPIARRVLDLHKPVEQHGSIRCEGCDTGSYSESDPAWPCSTVAAVAEFHGIDLPDADDLDMTYDRETKTYRRGPC